MTRPTRLPVPARETRRAPMTALPIGAARG